MLHKGRCGIRSVHRVLRGSGCRANVAEGVAVDAPHSRVGSALLTFAEPSATDLTMRTTAASLPFLALVLVGCDPAPPVVLAASQKDYFGSWEHVSSEYGNNIVSDNMLLIFHPDSTVSYKRCINR